MELNKIFFAGRLCHSPEVRFTTSNTAVCKLRLAANSTWKDKSTGERKEEATFIDVAFFGVQAEQASRHLTKGQEVLVEGELREDKWTGKDGKPRSGHSIRGHRWQFVGGKPQGRRVDTDDASEQPVARQGGAAEDESDLPF